MECGSDWLEGGGVKVVRLPGPKDKRDRNPSPLQMKGSQKI